MFGRGEGGHAYVVCAARSYGLAATSHTHRNTMGTTCRTSAALALAPRRGQGACRTSIALTLRRGTGKLLRGRLLRWLRLRHHFHSGGVLQATPLQKWQDPWRLSQMWHSGVNCPAAQVSLGMRSAARQ